MDAMRTDDFEAIKAGLRRAILREMARPIRRPTRLVEVVQVRMIPEPADEMLAVAAAPGEKSEPVVRDRHRPKDEPGTTFLHQFPNRKARRAKLKTGGAS